MNPVSETCSTHHATGFPDFFMQAPTLRVHDPLAEFLGAAAETGFAGVGPEHRFSRKHRHFATLWQAHVHAMLIEHADNPQLI